MRYTFALATVLLFLLTFNSYGQDYETDSLLHALAQPRDANNEIDILNRLAFNYTRISVLESEKYAQEALRKSQHARYLKGMAESFKVLGNIANLRNDYTRSVEYSYEALKLYEQIGDKAGQSKVLNNLGQVLMTLHEYDRAYHFTHQSLKLKREIGDSIGVANSILALGEYYRHKEKHLNFVRKRSAGTRYWMMILVLPTTCSRSEKFILIRTIVPRRPRITMKQFALREWPTMKCW